jgi:hypothetical protein
MKLAVIGSRDFNEYSLVEKEIKELEFQFGKITCIVSGGAKGADELGKMYARRHRVPTEIYDADWSEYGKSAGMIRNKLIIDNCDVLIAFWDGVSRGTKHSIDLIKQTDKPYKVILYNNTLKEWE